MSIRYTSHLSEITSELKQAKARSLEIIGGTAEGHAKERCPVDTGRLQNGITHARVSEDTEAIGTAVDYAPYVELGHNQQPGRYVPKLGKRLVASHVAGKPFLKPALDNYSEEYIQIARSEYGI